MKNKNGTKKLMGFSLFIVLSLLMQLTAFAQSKSISGTVTDEGGAPMPGVSVIIKGTTNGTATNIDGAYSISGVDANATLFFSFIGMEPSEVKVGDQTEINVSLKAQAYGLEEVVAVGYGTMKKANLTGSVDMVSAERLEARPISSVGEGLQGLIPNLNVTVFSGDPTRSTDLNVRGFESINGGAPLVLVDGVPMDLNRINPNDIESITVLKDAAAGAVYGARAAFGVVMVKTKKGTGKINVRLSSELSREVPIFNVTPVTNGYEYATIRNQILVAGGGTQYYNDDYMGRLKTYWDDPQNQPGYAVVDGNFENYEYTHMAEDVMNSFSPKQKYDLSVSGSGDKSSFYTSFGYLNQNGFLNLEGNPNYKRFNILMKGDFEINKWLSINQQISINSQRSDKPSELPVNSVIRVEPIRSFIVPYLEGYEELEGEYWSNPTEFQIQNSVKNGGRNIWSNTDTWLKTGIVLNPIKNLNIISDFAYQIYNRQQERGAPQFRSVAFDLTKENHFDLQGDNIVEVSSDHDQYYVFNAYAEYEMNQFEGHYLKAMVGFNQEWGKYTHVNGSALYPVAANVIDIGATTGTQMITGNKQHVSLRGAFYRVNYIFRDKYLLEANGRYDGTSRFGEDSRFGFFPSFSAAWRISKENFMEGASNWLDDLKFRVSYGTLGNQLLGTNYYPYIATMAVGEANVPLATGKLPVIRMPGLISPDLTWETVVTKNFGVDASFLRQRLNASFDIYTRETKDMLMRIDYPDILGTAAPYQNAADLVNKGWEFSLKWRDNVSSDLSYDLALALADYTAEITKYENPTGAIGEHYVGEMLGEIWGYETVGFIQDEEQLANLPDQSALGLGWELGDLEFKDQQKEGEPGYGVINQGSNTLDDPGDRKIIGNNSPRYTIALNSGIKYKDFSLSVFFQGVGKRDYYPSRNSWTWFFPFASLNMDQTWIDDAWRPDNRDAYWPRIQYNNKNYAPQTRYLQNAAYIRLKSLTFSYDLPETLLNKVALKSAKVYLAGQNLWEFSKIHHPLDPEYVFSNSIDYPLARTYSLGLVINF